ALYHSQSVEAFYAHVPGLKVVVPSTPYDAKGMLLQAIEDEDPVIYLEHKKTYRLIKGDVPDERYTIPLGKAVVRRPGTDLTCVSYGLMHHYCVEAAERLSSEGLEVEVVDLRSIFPLDIDTVLESIGKTSKAMVVYEDNKFLGVGAEVAAQIAEKAMFELDGPIVRIGGPHVPAMPFAPPLEAWFMPDVDKIEQEMRKLAEF
ncbi:MAG: alpha-ketoacid dehydrogenase subunit beta, partial [Actinomycetota bacterium]|nr:alpha-ketoacid dehydrogenase subunit beta [Actinomycetota bacterium]